MNEQIVQIEEDRVTFAFSEIISRIIIEKIISLTISHAHSKELDRKIPEFSFASITHTLNKMNEICYISQERDDMVEKAKNPTVDDLFDPQYNIFYTNEYVGKNDWSEISEPKKPKIDRAASTLIKMTTYKISSIPENTNIKLETSNIDSNMSRMNILKSSKRLITIPTLDHSQFSEPLAMREIAKMQKTSEDRVITRLREDKARQIIRQEEMELRNKVQKDLELKLMRIEVVKPKEVDGRKFTFDASGTKISMKSINVEKLYSDFSLPSFEVKDKGITTEMVFNPNTAKSVSKVSKIVEEVLFSKDSDSHRNYPTLNRTNNKSLANIKNNQEDEANEIVRKSIRKQTKKHTKSDSNYKNYDRPAVEPAGSSFEYISPEVGVTIFEGDRSKSGKMDYWNKFGKYSKYDYNQKLKQLANQSMPAINNSTLIIDHSLNNINNKSNIINFNDSHDNTTYSIYDNTNMLTMSLDYSKLQRSNIYDSARFNNSNFSRLRSAYDSLYLIPENEEQVEEENENSIFNTGGMILNDKLTRNKSDKRSQGFTLEQMNKFNESILKNPYWGNDDRNSANINSNSERKPKKLTKKEMEIEIGQSIVNVKLPRARVFNKILK